MPLLHSNEQIPGSPHSGPEVFALAQLIQLDPPATERLHSNARLLQLVNQCISAIVVTNS